MNLKALRLKDIGPYRGEHELDFAGLGGLVAIVGENGAGKSMLMDCAFASLYRSLPSRPEESVVDIATSRDAFIEATWKPAHAPAFQTRLQLDNIRRTIKPLVFNAGGDGVEALTDGKAATFREFLEPLVPDRNIVVASTFAAQGREGSFLTLPRAERRLLFAKLLGLERFSALHSKARAQRERHDHQGEHLRGQIAVHQEHAGVPIVSAKELDTLAKRLDEAVDRLTDLESKQNARSTALEDLRVRADENHTRVARLTERIRAGIENMERNAETVRDCNERLASDDLDVDKQLAVAKKRREVALANHDKEITEVQARHTELVAVLEVDRALLDALGPKIGQHQKSLAAIEERFQEFDGLVLEEQETGGVERTALQELQRLERATEIRKQVPCEGAGPYAACQFLKDAAAAADALPAAQEKHTRAANRHTRVADKLENLRAAGFHSEALAKDRNELDKRVRDLLADQTMANDTIRMNEQELQHIEQRIEAGKAQRSALENSHDSVIAGIRTTTEQRIRDVRQRLEAATDAGAEAELMVNREKKRLANTQKELDGRNREIADHRQALEELSKECLDQSLTVQGMREELALREKERSQVLETRKALKALQAEERELVGHAADWALLTEMFAPTGIPVSLVDAAGPIVTHHTNELLRDCLEGRFAVELITQAAKQRGGTKETFEILVYDGGDPRRATALSGGEQVLLDEALKAAISLYVRDQAEDTGLDTCFRDETTGALSVGNVDPYMTMLRRLQAAGRFRTLAFVTHNPDAAEAADHRVRIRRTAEGSVIEVE